MFKQVPKTTVNTTRTVTPQTASTGAEQMCRSDRLKTRMTMILESRKDLKNMQEARDWLEA